MELVRSLYSESGGDPSRFFELLDDQVEVVSKSHPLPDHPELIRGKGAVIEFYRHYWGTWDEYILEPAEIIDAGANRVLVVHQERGRGRGSGTQVFRRPTPRLGRRRGRVDPRGRAADGHVEHILLGR